MSVRDRPVCGRTEPADLDQQVDSGRERRTFIRLGQFREVSLPVKKTFDCFYNAFDLRFWTKSFKPRELGFMY
jgi:hypothetical protein